MTGITNSMYTGVKDKDGKDLYCGDIISFSFKNGLEGWMRRQGIIEWYDKTYKDGFRSQYFSVYSPFYSDNKRADFHYYMLNRMFNIKKEEHPDECEMHLMRYIKEKNNPPKKRRRRDNK